MLPHLVGYALAIANSLPCLVTAQSLAVASGPTKLSRSSFNHTELQPPNPSSPGARGSFGDERGTGSPSFAKLSGHDVLETESGLRRRAIENEGFDPRFWGMGNARNPSYPSRLALPPSGNTASSLPLGYGHGFFPSTTAGEAHHHYEPAQVQFTEQRRNQLSWPVEHPNLMPQPSLVQLQARAEMIQRGPPAVGPHPYQDLAYQQQPTHYRPLPQSQTRLRLDAPRQVLIRPQPFVPPRRVPEILTLQPNALRQQPRAMPPDMQQHARMLAEWRQRLQHLHSKVIPVLLREHDRAATQLAQLQRKPWQRAESSGPSGASRELLPVLPERSSDRAAERQTRPLPAAQRTSQQLASRIFYLQRRQREIRAELANAVAQSESPQGHRRRDLEQRKGEIDAELQTLRTEREGRREGPETPPRRHRERSPPLGPESRLW